MGTDELGIDKVKFVLKAGIELAEDVIEKSEGGFDVEEIISIAVSAVPDVITSIKDRKEFAAQIQDLSVEEKDELYEFAVLEFDIPNHNAERVVEAVLAVVLDVLALVDAINDLKEVA
jgi:hypothetical protein